MLTNYGDTPTAFSFNDYKARHSWPLCWHSPSKGQAWAAHTLVSCRCHPSLQALGPVFNITPVAGVVNPRSHALVRPPLHPSWFFPAPCLHFAPP